MSQSVKTQASLDDVMYLLEKVYEKEGKLEYKFDSLEKKVDYLKVSVENLKKDVKVLNSDVRELKTITTNSAGDIKDIQENTTVLSYHNSEHFDKDAEQDKRLDAHAKKLGLPAFTY